MRSAARMATMLASAQIAITSAAPMTASPGSSSTYLGKIGAHSAAAVLPTTKPIDAQAQRLLQDHPGDGAIACADQLEHRDLAHLGQRHRVDDEGDDRRADHGEDDEEHEDLLRRGGDQLGDEDLVHVGPGVGFEVLPAPDLARHDRFVGVRCQPQHDDVHRAAAGLARLHRLEEAGHARAVERRIGRGARAFVEQGIVVLEELHFLGVLQGYEDHRVAPRRHRAAGQPDDRVLVPADADPLVQPEPGPLIGDRLVVGAGDRAPGHQLARLAGAPRLEADQHHAHVAAGVLDLHVQIGDVAGLGDAANAEQCTVGVVAHVGRLRIRPQRVALHHPQVGADVAEQRPWRRRPSRDRCRPSTA